MEHDDVGAAELEMFQAADDALGIVEQVGDQHDHAALAQRIGQLMERLRHVGLGAESSADRA